jgi:hypothetical protein
VAVSGNQPSCPNAIGYPARRCFAINSATAGIADVTFYIAPAELHAGQSPQTLRIWRWMGAGTQWTEVVKGGFDSTCTTAANCSVTGVGVTSFGAFLLKNYDPTGVILAEFSAEQVADHVVLTWETTSELDNRGFNLYRGAAPAAPDRQLNSALIPSQSQGGPGGFVYRWEDRADLMPGSAYYYWVEEVNLSGATTMHGPVEVSFAAPAAVTIVSLELNTAAESDSLLIPTLLALAALILGGWGLRRRRA